MSCEDISHFRWLMGLVLRPHVLEIMTALHRGPRELDQLAEDADVEAHAELHEALAPLLEGAFVAATGDGNQRVYELAPRGSALLGQLVALHQGLANDRDSPEHTLVE